jgi:hypothetical protein
MVNVKQSPTANQPLHSSSPMTEKPGRQQYNSLVTAISLPALLRVLILKKIRTKDEVKTLLNKMKKNDHLILDPQVEKAIFF